MSYSFSGSSKVVQAEVGIGKGDYQYNGSPSAGNNTMTHTVPAGKKWIIKRIQAYSGGGGTFTAVYAQATISGVGPYSLVNGVTPWASLAFDFIQPIVADAGSTIQVVFVHSVTPGNLTSVLWVQEVNA